MNNNCKIGEKLIACIEANRGLIEQEFGKTKYGVN